MKTILLFLLPTLLMAEDLPWQLVWEDTFDGDELDFTKWAVEENAHGGGNEELQYYMDRSENVRVDDGNLIIEAHKENVEIAGVRRDYSSARIRTKRRADWTYGRFEVRAKLPNGPGLWPAVWLLPSEDKYGIWAASGEIDIVEVMGKHPELVHGSIHYGARWPDNEYQTGTVKSTPEQIAESFNTYALEWEENEIRWYYNDRLYYRTSRWHSTGGDYPAPFNRPFYLILNLAVGGKWPGPPDANTRFPAKMIVDYIRVYQKAPSDSYIQSKTEEAEAKSSAAGLIKD